MRTFQLIACFAFVTIHLNLVGQGNTITCVSGDCMNGFGKMQGSEPAPFTYEGEFVNGKWQGYGTLIVEKRYTNVGTFTNHAATGKGVVSFENGDLYRGQIVDAKLEGEGVYLLTSGETLTGTFRNNALWTGTGYLRLRKWNLLQGWNS